MMTPAERADLERLQAADQAEQAAERAKRDALVAADRGRDFDAGPSRGKPPRVTVQVETEHGTVLAPGTIDPDTAYAMRMEAAGLEWDGERWRGGFS